MRWIVMLAVACGSTTPAPRPDSTMHPPATCTPQFLGQLMTTAIAVAANERDAYWIDYEFGRLQHRALAGTRTVTLLPAREEQLISGLVVAPPYLYWPSKGEHGIFRFPLAGGKPERVIATPEGDGSEVIVYANGVVYATTFENKLLWYRIDGKSGARSDAAGILAGGPDGLYIADANGIQRLATPEGRLEMIVEAKAINELTISGSTLFWSEVSDTHNTIRRRAISGGEPVTLGTITGYTYTVFVPAPGGAYLSTSNVIYFAPLEGTTLRPVAIAASEITDLAAARDGVIVGTGAGSVHRVCPDPARAIELVTPIRKPLACGPGTTYQVFGDDEHCVDGEGRWVGPSRSWYRSGHLKAVESGSGAGKRSEEYYADGTRRFVSVGEGDAIVTKYFYANGELQIESIGESAKSYDLDGTPLR